MAKSFEAECSHSRSVGKGSYVGAIMIVTIDTMMIMVPFQRRPYPACLPFEALCALGCKRAATACGMRNAAKSRTTSAIEPG